MLLLLVTLTAIQVCSTIAQSGGNNNITSEEASGSGVGELPTPQSCHVPLHSDLNRGRVNLTDEEQEDLMMEGRCYLACTTMDIMVITIATQSLILSS